MTNITRTFKIRTMKIYYLHNGTEQQGPFDIDELKSKKITENTPIWYEGLSKWAIAGEIPELKEIFSPVTPPPFNVSKNVDEKVIKQEKKPLGRTLLTVLGIIVLGLIAILVTKLLQSQTRVEQNQTLIQNTESTKTEIRNNIANYVTAERSGFKYSELGGISELSITVKNRTAFMMDNVKVKISYIKANGGVWMDQYVDFPYLNANSEQTLPAPNSQRGVSVEYEIVSIKSTALGL